MKVSIELDYETLCDLTIANLKDSYDLCRKFRDEDAVDIQFHLRKVIEYYSAPTDYEEWYREAHGE